MILKILTQNLHCLVEEDIENKQIILKDKILEMDFDIIFLQEVAQSQVKDSNKKINTDNYGLTIKNLLKLEGKDYFYYYEPIKESFGIYDEGVGILSKYPLDLVESKFISKIREYSDWKSRKVLIYKLSIDNLEVYLATTHFGWSDGYEVFEEQFDLAVSNYDSEKLFILAGDFNVYPESSEYKYIINKGFIDIFDQSKEYFDRPTFRGDNDTHFKGRRLDYIMTNKRIELLDQEIFFIDDRISDHYGVYVKVKI